MQHKSLSQFLVTNTAATNKKRQQLAKKKIKLTTTTHATAYKLSLKRMQKIMMWLFLLSAKKGKYPQVFPQALCFYDRNKQPLCCMQQHHSTFKDMTTICLPTQKKKAKRLKVLVAFCFDSSFTGKLVASRFNLRFLT